jgi:hypothetical protein
VPADADHFRMAEDLLEDSALHDGKRPGPCADDREWAATRARQATAHAVLAAASQLAAISTTLEDIRSLLTEIRDEAR